MAGQNKLDQFYTKSHVVEHVLKMVDCTRYDLVVEPSAGAGDFLNQLPTDKTVALDLFPAAPKIEQRDFFDFQPDISSGVLTVGNPPFGKNSNTAVKFFNHAAEFSDCIAFVLPRTFRKASVINRLHKNFHLVKEEALPPDAFYLPTGESYSVPTTFQVWKRRDNEREKEAIYDSHPDFDFLGTDSYTFTDVDVTIITPMSYYGHPDKETYRMSEEELQQLKELRKKYPKMFSAHRIAKAKKKLTWKIKPDFAWRRAGSRAGEVFENYDEQPIEGFEFIKTNNKDVLKVFKAMWENTWNPEKNKEKKEEKWDTIGQPSISKHELIKFYIKQKEDNE